MVKKWAKEHEVAMLAAQRASILTREIFMTKDKGTLSKDDASPVTVGDFGAQALIIAAIKFNFPDDRIIAEENASALKENPSLRAAVWEFVKAARLNEARANNLIGGDIQTEREMLEFLDSGMDEGGPSGRFWAIDPIDGTKGFIRGGQYAICVALIADGKVRTGAIACPNLPADEKRRLDAGDGVDQRSGEGRGVIFSAVAGGGAYCRPLTKGVLMHGDQIHANELLDANTATMTESYESRHSDQPAQEEIAAKLGISKPPIRMDSQAKYGSVARGATDIYLRLPTDRLYLEKIWDHAAGDLIVREAGGMVTDLSGYPLDFSFGRTLSHNIGVVVAPKSIHAKVLRITNEVLDKRKVPLKERLLAQITRM